ncbi:MAG: acyloxyacyl hydrolase [Bacteroidota bacterium]
MSKLSKLLAITSRFSAKNFAFSVVQSLIIITLFFASLQTKSQNNQKPLFAEKGFNIGVSSYSITLPEGQNYKPLLLMGSFAWELTKKEKKGKWWLVFEPQINPVFLDKQLKEAEFGINVAFRYKYKLASTFYCYGQLGSGPHFITIPTVRQAHGFIFSDNLALGVSKTLNSNWMLNAEIRIRHISNASVMLPNRGMNNLFLIIGLSKKIFKG